MGAVSEHGRAAARILYIDDDEGLGLLLRRSLGKAGYDVDWVGDVPSGLERVGPDYDAVLVDYYLPGMRGTDFLRGVAGRTDTPPVVMLTGTDEVEVAVEAMKLGAADFIVKDVQTAYLGLLPSILERVTAQRELLEGKQKAEELAQVTLRCIGDAVITTDARGTVSYLNPVAARLTGWQAAEAFGKPLGEVLQIKDEHSGTRLETPLERVVVCEEEICPAEQTVLVRRDGECTPIRELAAPLRNRAGEVIGSVIVVQDVSRWREYERGLELFATVFEQSAEAMLITDAQARILDVNDAFCRITGYGREEVLGKDPGMMSSGRHDRAFFEAMWEQLQAHGCWQGEIWDRRKSGEIYPKWLSINAVREERGAIRYYVGVFSDISTIKQTERQLQRLAHYDPLTGLPNRILFGDRLAQALLRASREGHIVALLFVDLDRFKVLNDTYGHHAGDELLSQFSQRLCQQVRESDTVARLGGDEFTLILNDISLPDDASHVAEKIIEVCAEPFVIDGRVFHTSPSIGISLYPYAGRDAEALLKAADSAMYQAKQAGRNTYRFYRRDVQRWGTDSAVVHEEMAQALEREQLALEFQPQYDLAECRPVAVEALLRWQHPQLGVVGPERFLRTPDETGIAAAAGRWVLQSGCEHLQRWRSNGRAGLRLAINAGLHELLEEGFRRRLGEVLERYELEPQALVLEVSEKAIVQGAEGLEGVLHSLSDLGVSLAVDRFGTGDVGLARLLRLRPGFIKLDRSVVRDLGHSRLADAVAQAAVAVARVLPLEVVAEGIEEAAQVDVARACGCTLGQGFHLGGPVAAGQVETLLGS